MSPRVHCLSPFVPREWIEAHGLVPVPLALDARSACPPEGVCPAAWAAAGAADAAGDDLVVAATTCDQLRRALEEPKPRRFLMHVPATCGDAARHFYANELRRLGAFLVSHGGTVPSATRLSNVMLSADAGKPATSTTPTGRLRIMLVASHLRTEDAWLRSALAEAGAEVAVDASDYGTRTQRRRFAPMAPDPFAELVAAYFDAIPDFFRRPDDLLQAYIHREVEANAVEAVLVTRYLWCDLCHAVIGRLRDTLRVPVVEIQLGGGPGAQTQARARVEALVESLR